MNTLPYCQSRTQTRRRVSREVAIGNVVIGGSHPIAVQSMTTTPTEDVDATVAQTRELFEAGCEIVRITAPSMRAARALRDIRQRLLKDGFSQPLVADIHFMPKAAMEAAEHVEKVRINPGNFADYKKFKQMNYTDSEYQTELERLYEAFTPFVIKCKAFGRSIRIGTNHGSLSDRIMNRYGDTPEGMVESAMEFIRIAESHGFRDIILSMKASNPKVMIAAYRLAVARMEAENMAYPLHLGVTEAGDGEDGRVKSTIGIGALLADGLGDTLRVSLTEDPVHEVPVGQALVSQAIRLQQATPKEEMTTVSEPLDFYAPARQAVSFETETEALKLNPDIPRVALALPEYRDVQEIISQVSKVQMKRRDAGMDYLILPVRDRNTVSMLTQLSDCLTGAVEGLIVDCTNTGLLDEIAACFNPNIRSLVSIPLDEVKKGPLPSLPSTATWCLDGGHTPNLEATLQDLSLPEHFWFTLSSPLSGCHGIGSYRKANALLRNLGHQAPIWIRAIPELFTSNAHARCDLLLECSLLAGTLLCDGIGNMISVETDPDLERATTLAFNVLQGARARISKTEFVACPSCGRTLFNLQSTTHKIRERTGHLKNVTIAIMGCIVNGPGEMADADFGYVGGAPGKVNLYVGKTCVQNGIPEADAVDALIGLIQAHGKWVEPDPTVY